jgi:uncharacterized membrane protein
MNQLKAQSPLIAFLTRTLLIGVVLYFVGSILYFGGRWLGLLPAGASATATTVTGRVVEIVEEGTLATNNGQPQPYQLLQVEIEEGRWAGQRVTIDYGKTQLAPPGMVVGVGDSILVDFTQMADGNWQPFFLDFVRTPSMLWLTAIFVFCTVLLSGWKGVRSIVATIFSFFVIISFMLPRILAGENPVLVSTIGAFIILATTLYVVYGWTVKTHAAVLGILIALSLTGLIAYYFIGFNHLTGFGSEEAMFLSQQLSVAIDLRGLVLSSILIGSLGVLDDLVITQTSTVFELRAANSTLIFRDLYSRAMRVGQDHVAATVNTLILAYTGAALPLLLLVTLAGEQFGTFINREFVAEEVVRTMVGSLGLMAAVPITTGLACLVVLHHDRLGALRPFLGPLSGSDEDGHHHHH